MKTNPIHLSPEALLAEYTPLVFRTVKAYLSDPEDIKEVVNDTFFEFYRCEERFHEEKGSCSALLTTIAKRNAIDRLRNNKRLPVHKNFSTDNAEPEAPIDVEGSVTDRMAVEEALNQLDEDELELIRAKYYDGKSLHEIAEEMHLPYETVKKRHQRSIKKLRLVLLLTILIALLLAGCAAYVAQKIGIIPGFGVSTSESEHFYTLTKPVAVAVPDTDLTLTFLSVTCEGNTLAFQFTLTHEDGTDYRNPYEDDPRYADRNLYWVDNEWNHSSASIGDFTMDGTNYHTSYSDPDTGLTIYDAEIYEYTKGFDKIVGELEDSSSPTVVFRLLWNFYVVDSSDTLDEDGFLQYLESTTIDVTASLPLTEISVEAMEAYAYEYVEGQGGLVAIPRLENGHLIAAIYPIQPETGVINPGLSYNDYTIDKAGLLKSSDTFPESTIYAVAEDGSILEGTCSALDTVNYNSHYYYEWDFGPAEPGNYTIVVPYLLKTYGSDRYYVFPLDVGSGEFNARKIAFDGGTLQLTDLTPTSWEELADDGYDTEEYISDSYDSDLLWIIGAQVELDAPDETVVYLTMAAENTNPYFTSLGIQDDTPIEERLLGISRLSYPTDSSYQMLLTWYDGQNYYDANEGKKLWLRLETYFYRSNHSSWSGITARWNHRFELEVTVE